MATVMPSDLLVPLYGPVYGSIYFGTVLTTAFYGATCMQTFFYYVHYQNDLLRTKSLVAIIWVLDTAHVALTVSGTYRHIRAGLLDPSSVFDGIPELILQILPTTLVAILTQGFLVYRIYVFSGRKMIAPLIWLTLSMLQLVSVPLYVSKALYIANGVQAVGLDMLNKDPLLTLSTLSLSVAAGEDVLIAICTTLLLIRERTATDFASTLHILQRLTVFAVNTGIWTATFALLSLIFMDVLAFPFMMYNSVVLIPLCPLYCNTLLANLNARSYIGAETADCITSLPVPCSTVEPAKRGSRADMDFGHQANMSRKEMVSFVGA